MAAIEKMCEYGSKEYLGWEMYNAKRNLIQVNPDKRKYFRKQKATLMFFKPTNLVHRMGKYTSSIDQDDNYFHEKIRGKWCVWKNHWWGNMAYAYPITATTEYDYVLIVPTVQGKVKGQYYHQTFSKGDVIRRIKRLVGGDKYLTVVKSPLTLSEHFKAKREQ